MDTVINNIKKKDDEIEVIRFFELCKVSKLEKKVHKSRTLTYSYFKGVVHLIPCREEDEMKFIVVSVEPKVKRMIK